MFTIQTRRVAQHTTIIEIAGRLDSINAAALQNRLMELLQQTHNQQIILHMAQVNYISAAGLRILKMVQDHVGQVNIAQPSPRVVEVLQITGLDVVYKLYESQTAAVHHVHAITNAHTHLEASWLRHGCPDVIGMDFVDWIKQRVTNNPAKHGSSEKDVVNAIENSIEALIDAGTTMIGDISYTGLSIAPLLNSGLRGVVYIELIGTHPITVQERFERVRLMIDQWRPKERNGLKIGLALHTPYSLHPSVWQPALDYAAREKLPLCIHAAESPAEAEFMLHGTGKILSHYYDDKFPAIPSPRQSSIAYLEAVGALAQKPLLVHAVQVADDDIAKIKTAGATVVHCPRSNLRLQCGRMPLEKFLAAQIPVLLGTDSLVSAPSLNIFDELETAVALHYGQVAPAVLMNMLHGTLPSLS
jgi:anti-anti-sigma factor